MVLVAALGAEARHEGALKLVGQWAVGAWPGAESVERAGALGVMPLVHRVANVGVGIYAGPFRLRRRAKGIPRCNPTYRRVSAQRLDGPCSSLSTPCTDDSCLFFMQDGCVHSAPWVLSCVVLRAAGVV